MPDRPILEELFHQVEESNARYESLPEWAQPMWYRRLYKMCLSPIQLGPFNNYECENNKGHTDPHYYNYNLWTTITWKDKDE